jgi:hypothetical protein
MATVLGIPVRYEPIGIEEFTSILNSRGYPAHLVQHLAHIAADYRNGLFAGTNDNVERITGRAPMSVSDFVLANLSSFARESA